MKLQSTYFLDVEIMLLVSIFYIFIYIYLLVYMLFKILQYGAPVTNNFFLLVMYHYFHFT